MTKPSRRNNNRLPIKLSVKITTDFFCTRSVMTKNFSDGGLFIIDNDLAGLPVDTLLTVQADEGLAEAPIVNARIAWTNEKGAGIEYSSD